MSIMLGSKVALGKENRGDAQSRPCKRSAKSRANHRIALTLPPFLQISGYISVLPVSVYAALGVLGG